jgi:hypothetical protein
MSMMTNNMLNIVEQRLKQSIHLDSISPFETKLVVIVGDLAQLLPIYKTYYSKHIMQKLPH